MDIYRKITRLRNSLKFVVNCYKNGGYTSVNVSLPNYGEILNGKTILITGGSTGIGYAIAKKCIDCGAKVIITGRNESKLQFAIEKLGTPKCKYIVWNVSNIDCTENKLKECVSYFNSPIDVLVNNAGIAPSKFWGNVDESEWNTVYNNNLKGLYFLTQRIVNNWKIEKTAYYKKIINISSQGGFVGATYPYRMVKWDIRGLTEGLGRLLIKENILVNGIAPGIVKTSMQQFSLIQGDNMFTEQNPAQRICLPEEIAELALFLISDASNFIVGQTIVCDGGYILK